MNGKNSQNSTTVSTPKSAFAQIKASYIKVLVIGLMGWVALAASIVLSTGASFVGLQVAGLVGASFFVGLGVWGLRVAAVMPVLSSSYNLIQAGKLTEAESLLHTLASHKAKNIVSVVGLQRATIAIRRGDLEGALRHLDAPTARKVRFRDGPLGEVQLALGFGHRAWVRAVSGNTEGAAADIRTVRASLPNPEAFALASLAEALLLQRAGDRAKLAAVLKRDRLLLLAALQLRERALVRAMSRMLRAPVESVYRTKVDPKTADEKDNLPLTEWVDRVAPDLSNFAPATVGAPTETTESTPSTLIPSPEALARVKANTPKKSGNRALRVLVLWGLLIVMFLAIWQFLQPARNPHPSRRPTAAIVTLPPNNQAAMALATGLVLFTLALTFFVVRRVRKSRAQTRKLYALQYGILAGLEVDADLAELAVDKAELTAAQAELMRASIADRRGDIPSSLAHIEAARAKIQSNATRLAASGFLTPGITSARAYALAALQRPDEAAAEMAQLPPDYAFLTRMRFVVPLIAFAAEGDLENAGRLVAATSPELEVAYRDELLRDIVRAVMSPTTMGASELARLRDEFVDREEDRRWMMRVTPALVERFDAAVAGDGDNQQKSAPHEP